MPRRDVLTCLGLFLLSQALFLINIQYPRGYSFDEVFYVPAARAFLHWTANTNRVHPPLGKYLIAIGMWICGDTPFGWRFMSSIFGGLTLGGMYCWGLAVFRRHSTALWMALITLLNQLLYIQARTGMLDVFMFTFMVWGLAAFCAAWSRDIAPHRARALLLFTGLMFGLTTACKWLGVVPWFTALGFIVLARIVKPFRPPSDTSTHHHADDEPWYTPDLLRTVGWPTIVLALVVVPIITYALTFAPLLWLPGPDASLHGLWDHQLAIWHEHTTAGGPPVQSSRWYQWPLNSRPMWYWFNREQDDGRFARVVLLMGNPVVLWTGFVSLAVCLWSWLKRGSRQAFLALLWYAALFLSWAVIPRRITYYYYYYPAAMALSLALAFVAQRTQDRKLLGIPAPWVLMALTAVMFAIRLPVSSAMRIRLDWITW